MLNFFKAARETAAAGNGQIALTPRERRLLREEIERTQGAIETILSRWWIPP